MKNSARGVALCRSARGGSLHVCRRLKSLSFRGTRNYVLMHTLNVRASLASLPRCARISSAAARAIPDAEKTGALRMYVGARIFANDVRARLHKARSTQFVSFREERQSRSVRV